MWWYGLFACFRLLLTSFFVLSIFQEQINTSLPKRIRLQQILFKSVIQNDLEMVNRCLGHEADINEEYLPVSIMKDT